MNMLEFLMVKGKYTKEEIYQMRKDQILSRKSQANGERQINKNYDDPEEVKFADAMRSMDLVIKIMEADGNCLFRALADQISGNQKLHMEIRGKVMDYIDKNKEHFSLFMEDDEKFDTYVARMRKSGEWGGNQELYAASQCLHVNIYVHQVHAPRYVMTCAEAKQDIHLSYHGECHYNSVRSRNDPDRGDPPLPINLNESVELAQERAKVSKEIEEKKIEMDANTNTLTNIWVAPDIMKFVQDSYEAIEDCYEEVIEMAASLTSISDSPDVKVLPRKEGRRSRDSQATMQIKETNPVVEAPLESPIADVETGQVLRRTVSHAIQI